MDKKILRCIGDCHQQYQFLMPLRQGADYVLQVGDLGLDYRYVRRILRDADNFWAISGNHDCYEQDSPEYFKKQPFFLGDFGTHIFGNLEIFYVRGAWSIDHKWRQREAAGGGPLTWWEEEELTTEQGDQALELYKKLKPDFVVTHECPLDLVEFVTDPEFALKFGYPSGVTKTRTNVLLQAMLDFHKPRTWIFGHYHVRWEGEINGTKFTCLDMINPRYPADITSAYLDVEV